MIFSHIKAQVLYLVIGSSCMAAPTFTLVLPRFPAIIFLAYNKHIISITCYCRWVVNTLALRAVLTHTCLLIRNYIVQSELPAKLLMLNKGVWRGGGGGGGGGVGGGRVEL